MIRLSSTHAKVLHSKEVYKKCGGEIFRVTKYALYIIIIVMLQLFRGSASAHTFVQDGAITEYATQLGFTMPGDARIISHITNKIEGVLYKSVIPVGQMTEVFSTDKVNHIWSNWHISSPNDIQMHLSSKKNTQSNVLKNFLTDTISMFVRNKYMSMSTTSTHFIGSYTKQSVTYKNNKVLNNDNEQLFPTKNHKTATGQSNTFHALTRHLFTVTYYGFSEFTTVVGDSVIIFSPNTPYSNKNSWDSGLTKKKCITYTRSTGSEYNVANVSTDVWTSAYILKPTAVQNKTTNDVIASKTVEIEVEARANSTIRSSYYEIIRDNSTFNDHRETMTYINAPNVWDSDNSAPINENTDNIQYINSTSITIYNHTSINLITPSKVLPGLSIPSISTTKETSSLHSDVTTKSSIQDLLRLSTIERCHIRSIDYNDLNTNDNCKLTSKVFVNRMLATPVSDLSVLGINVPNLAHGILHQTVTKYFYSESKTCNMSNKLKNHETILYESKQNTREDNHQRPIINYGTLSKDYDCHAIFSNSGYFYGNTDIELLYKTLYTVYTYLTTYFNNDTSSLRRQTEALSKIHISEWDISPTNSHMDVHNTKDFEMWKSAFLKRGSFQSEQFIELENENCQNCPRPTNSGIHPPEEKVTLYTTYTYYTTIFSGTNSRLILHSAVLEGSTQNIKTNEIRDYSNSSNITEKLCSTISNITDMNSRLYTSLLLTDVGNREIKHYNKKKYSAIITANNSSMIELPTKNAKKKDNKMYRVHTDPFNSEMLLLVQTGFTTHTYFTTLYSNEKTDFTSHLETATTTMIKTYSISPTNKKVGSILPITYYTTFTYWTKLATKNQITTMSREETVSNIVTPTNDLHFMESSPSLQNFINGQLAEIETNNIFDSIRDLNEVDNSQTTYANCCQLSNEIQNRNYYEIIRNTGISYTSTLSMPTIYMEIYETDQIPTINLDTLSMSVLSTKRYLVETAGFSLSESENQLIKIKNRYNTETFSQTIETNVNNSAMDILQSKQLDTSLIFQFTQTTNEISPTYSTLRNYDSIELGNQIIPFRIKTQLFTSEPLPVIRPGRSHHAIMDNYIISASKTTPIVINSPSVPLLNKNDYEIDRVFLQTLHPIQLEGTVTNFHLRSSNIIGLSLNKLGTEFSSPPAYVGSDFSFTSPHELSNHQNEYLPHTQRNQDDFKKVENHNLFSPLRIPSYKPREFKTIKKISTEGNTPGDTYVPKLNVFNGPTFSSSRRTRSRISSVGIENQTYLSQIDTKKIVYDNSTTHCIENKCKFKTRQRRSNVRNDRPLITNLKPTIESEVSPVKTTRRRFRRPLPSINQRDKDRTTYEGKPGVSKIQPQNIIRHRPRSDIGSKNADTTTKTFIGSNKRLVRPSHSLTMSNTRSKFTLREKEHTTQSNQKNQNPVRRISFRKPVSGVKSKRLSSTTATQALVGKRRLSSNTHNDSSSSLHRGRPYNTGRSRAGSYRESEVGTRNRVYNDNVNDEMVLENSGIITITHDVPVDTYFPVVNGKSTDLKHIVTLKTSTEILEPHQYTQTLSANGQTYLALTSVSSSLNANGVTEVIHFILHEIPTTTIAFTPTSIRGRKTSFSLILPSTAYSVENVISTIQPQIQADTPLANILLSQLLLGNVGFPTNLLYGLYNGSPTQTALEYITHTSTFVTTLLEGKSTIIPLTFQGKKILTTIYDTTAQIITATEYITDTIITTPSTMPNVPMVNSLLLQQLLFQNVAEPIKDLNINSKAASFENKQEFLEDRVHHLDQQDLMDSIETVNVDVTNMLRERTKSRRSGKKHKRKHKQETVSDEESIITLFVSGRRPGEFSTVLSTLRPDITLHKRHAQLTYGLYG